MVDKKRIVVIGMSAAGPKAMAKARHKDEHAGGKRQAHEIRRI